MLKKIHFSNFKGFQGSHEAPLSRITLIFGANSAGKSALIHLLALVAQSTPRVGPGLASTHPLVFSGRNVDLGGFRNVINAHDESLPLQVAFDVSPAERGRGPRMSSRSMNPFESVDTFNYGVSFRMEKGTLNLTRIQFALSRQNGSHASSRVEVLLEDPQVVEDRPRQLQWSLRMDADDLRSLIGMLGIVPKSESDSWDDDIDVLMRDALRFLPTARWSDDEFDSAFRELSEQPFNTENSSLWRGPFARSSWSALRNRKVHAVSKPSDGFSVLLSAALDSASGHARTHFSSLSYLGPMRAAPQRLEDLQQFSESLTYSDGSGTTAILYRNKRLCERVNQALARMDVPYTVEPIQIANDAHPTIGEYLALKLEDQRTGVPVSPRDVGYGVSQLLPVITEACRESTGPLLIEQPELHLHPRLQASLAEVLAEASINRQIIIETHSENMLLRLQRMIREGRLAPNDLSVLYVNSSDATGSWVTPLSFGADGELLDEWPHGFFEERMAEY